MAPTTPARIAPPCRRARRLTWMTRTSTASPAAQTTLISWSAGTTPLRERRSLAQPATPKRPLGVRRTLATSCKGGVEPLARADLVSFIALWDGASGERGLPPCSHSSLRSGQAYDHPLQRRPAPLRQPTEAPCRQGQGVRSPAELHRCRRRRPRTRASSPDGPGSPEAHRHVKEHG